MKDVATIVGIIVALTELIKRIGVPSKFAPFISIAVGVGISGVWNGFGTDGILQGVIYGLMASGLWSSSKATLELSGVIKTKGIRK